MNTLLYFIFVSLCGISYGLRIPVTARSSQDIVARGMNHGQHKMHHGTGVRMWQANGRKTNKGKKGNNLAAQAGSKENIENAKDVVYATNLTIGGREFPIQLDTGSSDLWIKPPFNVSFTNQTNLQTNLTFGIGTASGNIAFADVSLGPYKVKNQALLNAKTADNFGAIFNNNIFGILGLAFDQSSSVFIETLVNFGKNNTQGRTFLGNIFAQNKTAPNMFSVLLGRTGDPSGDQEGVFTIGEYDPQFKNVTQQPKLFRTPAQLENITTEPRWSIQMDKMLVNGKEFTFNKSLVSEAAPGKTVMVLDTGFTFAQFPPAAVNAIYSTIKGAVQNQTSGLWTVPCDQTTKLEFVFGGKTIPIHPLDITVVKTVGNQTVCQNTFRNLNLPVDATSSDIGFDGILGVPFLKNVYASFDFGDIENGKLGVPFIRMVPTTDLNEAQGEFQKVRPQQVNWAKQNAASGAAGSISFEDSLNSISLTHAFSNDIPVKRAFRMIVSGRFPMPFRFHRIVPTRVMHCMHRVAKSKPVVLALIIGAIFMSVSSCVVAIALAIRAYRRSGGPEQREDGYEIVWEEPKDDEEVEDYERRRAMDGSSRSIYD